MSGGQATAPVVQFRGDALVRCGKTGQPKFDDPKTCPNGVKKLLTLGEMLYLDEQLISDLGLLEVRETLKRIFP